MLCVWEHTVQCVSQSNGDLQAIRNETMHFPRQASLWDMQQIHHSMQTPCATIIVLLCCVRKLFNLPSILCVHYVHKAKLGKHYSHKMQCMGTCYTLQMNCVRNKFT
jgi:hypothetical protein